MRSTDTVISHGTVAVPQSIQEALGLRDGSPVSLRLEEGKLIIEPCACDSVTAMQDLFSGAKYSLEDDLKEFRAAQW